MTDFDARLLFPGCNDKLFEDMTMKGIAKFSADPNVWMLPSVQLAWPSQSLAAITAPSERVRKETLSALHWSFGNQSEVQAMSEAGLFPLIVDMIEGCQCQINVKFEALIPA